jgi:DNA-binding transcriptional LysR family regulator
MKTDLNLFTVFEAIYCEGNITKAAAVLNLSQPAVSHSLSKLRDQFDDPLFVRHGNEMRPTAVAKNVAADVREALHQLQVCLQQSKQFAPATSRKEFIMSIHGPTEAIYLPSLVQNVILEAPKVTIKSHRRVRQAELENKLASGDIDMAIDALLPVSENIKHTLLEQNEMVVISRQNNSQIKNKLDLDTYLALEHIVVSSRSSGPGIEDFQLGRLSLQRKIALRCQHTLAACRVILGSDMLLTLPKNAAKMYKEMIDIKIHKLPVELPSIDMHLYWHTNVDKDPANKWLRNMAIMAADH